jgi:hypothetical protein
MNLLCNTPTFQKTNVFFLDIKKNMVINGLFTKIIYTDSMISLNGLYLHCPLEYSNVYQEEERNNNETNEINEIYFLDNKKVNIFLSNSLNNANLIKELYRIEHEIIEQYKEYFKVQKANVYSLRNQLKTGSIKINSKSFTGNTNEENNTIIPFILKISGIWETDVNVGITFKFQL